MKAFFLALLFAKVLLLTPQPVTFERRYEIVSKEIMTALDPGAAIEIKVTGMVPKEIMTRPFESQERVKAIFPPDSITARMIDASGKETTLFYRGFAAISNDNVWLILDKEGGISTQSKFVKVVIDNKILLRDVEIYWRNYEK